MERPTCRTCPYWVNGPKVMDVGECRRGLPRFAATEGQYRDMERTCWSEWAGTWPETNAESWCGEHPDFPAYLASRQPLPPGGVG